MIFSSAPNDFLNLKYSDELYHHGIKGQRWGVRRYQNPDGSLTAEGTRRYGQMSDRELAKTLKKQIRDRRVDVSNRSNRWMHGMEIGEYSKRFKEERKKAIKEYESSPEYKKWEQKAKQLEKKEYYDGYDEEWEALMKEQPKRPALAGRVGGIVSFNGTKYVKESLPVLEKQTVAQLQDLGYSYDTAKSLVDRLVKSNNLFDA